MTLPRNLEIAIFVNWDVCNKNRIFKGSGNFDAKKFFAEKGISINTHDTYDDFTKCDYVVFFELDDIFRNEIFVECLKRKLENKLIYFAFEGELHNKQYTSISGLKNAANYFKYIFTWNDDFVDNKKFFKFNLGYNLDLFSNVLEPKNRNKLLTSISGNHIHSNPKELYSKRLEIIDFFENNFSDDYEFYGKGWDKTLFKNYRGSVESKYHTYLNYKFAICFENARFMGYITEKIFDCLVARTVPIYLGAPNIAEHIPSNCFIDYTQFDSIREMYDFIKNMDDNTYNDYILNINSFLNSDLIKPFSWETFYTNLYKVIEQDQNNSEIFKIKANKRFLILFKNTLGNINKPIRNVERTISRNIKKHAKTLMRK